MPPASWSSSRIAVKLDLRLGGNLQGMGRDLAQDGLLAIGESLVILTGGIDLSVGALAGLAGVLLTAWFNVRGGMPAGRWRSCSRW